MNAQLTARLGLSGTLECRNAAGEVIQTIEINGSIPITELGLTEEQATQLIEESNGPDLRK